MMIGRRPRLLASVAVARTQALVEQPVIRSVSTRRAIRWPTKGVPVIYTTSPYPDRSAFKSAADLSPNFRAWDRRACEIDERVRPQPGEYVIRKEHASAFAGTPLVGHLLGRRVDTLLITGCSTSACVRATATDAKSYQLRPIIIREAVQDRSEVAHEWTLFDIQARFADVVSLEETLGYLRGLAGQE